MKKIISKLDNIPFKYLASVFIIFLVGMILGAFGYVKLFRSSTPPVVEPIQVNTNLPQIIEEKRETTEDAKTFNILLSGNGGAGHSGGGLMDAIIAVHVNLTDKKASIISIPRDLWFSGHKVNADPSLKDAITGITGLTISNSISIDFDSFIKLVDILGGITVDVKNTYTDNFYPIRGKENELCDFAPEKVTDLHQKYSGFELEKQFTCRYETISYTVGLHEMTGEEALKYVRSRHGGSDFERSRHQFEVLKAILQKGNISSVGKALDFVKTDITVDKLNEYVKEIGNPLEYSISFLGISDQNVLVSSKSSAGAYILIPKEGEGKFDGVKKFVNESI